MSKYGIETPLLMKLFLVFEMEILGVLANPCTALFTCFPILFGRHTEALAVWLVFL